MNILNILYKNILRENAPNPKFARVKDPTTINWSLPNSELMKKFKVQNRNTVNRWRKKYAPHLVNTKFYPKNVDWPNVDWSKKDKELAAMHNVHRVAVSDKRRELANSTRSGLGKRGIDWKNADWTKSNKELGRIYNVNPRNIIKMRQDWSHTANPSKPGRPAKQIKIQPPPSISPQSKNIDQHWAHLNWTKPDEVLAKELNTPVFSVGIMRRLYAPPKLRKL